MTAHAESNLTFLPRRTTVLIAIVGLHVAIIYAFASGLAVRFIEPPPPMKVDVVRETLSKPTPPPLHPINFRPTKIVDTEPLIPVTTDTGDTIHDLLPQPTTGPTTLTPPRPPTPVKRVAGGPGKGFPNSDDYYPPAARRLNEEGSAAVQVCVDTSGKLTAEPTITQSSGNARLDEGAIRLAKAGSGHYRPTTENGVPVSSCYGYLIRFDLK